MIETTILRLDKPTVSGDADAWGGMLNTNADDLDIFVARPRWQKAAIANGPTAVLNLALGNFFEFTVDQAKTVSITNVPATLPDTTVPFTQIVLKITNGGAFTITWPVSIVWPFETANAAPTGLAGSGVDIIELVTYNAGTTWYAMIQHIKADPNLWPRASVYKSANQGVSGGGDTAISFDLERYDVGVMHDTVTNNSRLTIPSGQGGLYLIVGHLNMNTSVPGRIKVRKNGATLLRETEAFGLTQHHIAIIEVLAAGDYVELVFNDDGTNTVFSGIEKTSFEIAKLR